MTLKESFFKAVEYPGTGIVVMAGFSVSFANHAAEGNLHSGLIDLVFLGYIYCVGVKGKSWMF